MPSSLVIRMRMKGPFVAPWINQPWGWGKPWPQGKVAGLSIVPRKMQPVEGEGARCRRERCPPFAWASDTHGLRSVGVLIADRRVRLMRSWDGDGQGRNTASCQA